METNQKGVVTKRVYFGTIVVLLLINTFTLYLFFSERNVKDNISTQQTALKAEFRELTDTLDVRNEELEKWMGKNAELDQVLSDKQLLIDNQKKKLESLLTKNKLTQSELSKAREMIAQYQVMISEVTAKLDQLTMENQQLASANEQLNKDLTSERSINTQLSEKNGQLAKKVEIGSLLPIANLDVEAVKTRSNGKEVEVKRAKTAANLRISFETGENKVIDPGQVSLYVRIINPKGETIALEDQGSGILTTPDSPEPVVYTKKADIEYNQANKKVVVYWGKHINEPGIYKVELYQAGYVIGQGEVKLS